MNTQTPAIKQYITLLNTKGCSNNLSHEQSIKHRGKKIKKDQQEYLKTFLNEVLLQG